MVVPRPWAEESRVSGPTFTGKTIFLFSQTSRPARSQLISSRLVSPGIKRLWREPDPSLPSCVEI
jgi:hypothetical protein